MTMVMSHRTRRYRGSMPDDFCTSDDDDPAVWLGRTGHGGWHDDDTIVNVEVCRSCDWARGIQCDECAEIRAIVRRGDLRQRAERRIQPTINQERDTK